jgi:hypothetical protein
VLVGDNTLGTVCYPEGEIENILNVKTSFEILEITKACAS